MIRENEIIKIISQASKLVKASISDPEAHKEINLKQDGDITKQIDLISESFIEGKLKTVISNYQLISEENQFKYNPNPKYTILLDPVDGTEMLLRGYPLGNIAMSIHLTESMKTIFGIVVDITTEIIYYANEIGAYKIENNKKSDIKTSSIKSLKESFIGSYFGKNPRIQQFMEYKNLIASINRVFNYGGPLEIIRVAYGGADAFLEFVKGFKSIDYASAVYIAQKAGAKVTNLKGTELIINEDLFKREKFVVAATDELLYEILNTIDNDKSSFN